MSRTAELDPAAYALPEELAAELLSPALVVYLDAVRENLRRVIAACGGDPDRWRPHVKTTKIPEVWAELPRAGLRHFKCATTREAALLADVLEREGVESGDVLVAYPLVGPALGRMEQIAAEHPAVSFSVLVEDAQTAARVPDRLSIFIDLNPGMDRTGVPLARQDEIRAIARAAGARFRGLHFYDGHRCDPNLEERRQRAFDDYDRLMALVGGLRGAGIEVEELITSGTPAFRCALAYDPFQGAEAPRHRVSPGTVVFHDLRSEEENPDLALRPAALVFARVVSQPTPTTATCDAGSKSLAADAGDPCAAVLGHPGWTALTPNEEHLPLRVPSGELPPRGSRLLLIPRHVCPTVNLAEQAVLVEGGVVRDVVGVRARAHELLPAR